MTKTIAQVAQEFFKDKKVLVRVDFNVPQNSDGSVSDDSRIKAAQKTIGYLTSAGAKVILVSHLGRPKGKEQKYSLRPIAKRLSELLASQGVHVEFAEDCIGSPAQSKVDLLEPGQICLLENVRFHPEEEKNDRQFARQLA